MFDALKGFDFYPKTQSDFKVKTLSGGAVTIVSGLIILVLFFSELSGYLTPQKEVHINVDSALNRRMTINVNIVFPYVGCSLLSVDAMDVSGEQQNDLSHSIRKLRLDAEGNPVKHNPEDDKHREESIDDFFKVHSVEKHEVNAPPVNVTAVERVTKPGYCGSCYGAADKPGQCCNTCEEVREAYRRKAWVFNSKVEQCQKENVELRLQQEKHEGCQIYGWLEVQRVAGNFHFAPGKSFQHAQFHVHDFMSIGDASKYNMTHYIQHLSFGEYHPEMHMPLDGEKRYPLKPGMFQYYVKVVPTVIKDAGSNDIHTNQYSYTEHFKIAPPQQAARTLPGVFFIYDISPILVTIDISRRSFLHFITQLCAVIGGVFSVATMADAIFYKTQRIMEKKQSVGKLG